MKVHQACFFPQAIRKFNKVLFKKRSNFSCLLYEKGAVSRLPLWMLVRYDGLAFLVRLFVSFCVVVSAFIGNGGDFPFWTDLDQFGTAYLASWR